MYRHCIFCHRPLGSNEVVESFPVGRSLAFDGARGRLWVVCPHCERWNLTPLEERWEAVEECEREFRGTRIRASTPNVGLARLPEGLTLIRIGEPLRPEFAAWRYVSRFRARHRRALVVGGVAVGANVLLGINVLTSVAGMAGLAAAGAAFGLGSLAWSLSTLARQTFERRKEQFDKGVLLRVPTPEGETIVLRRDQVDNVIWNPAADGRPWSLQVHDHDHERVQAALEQHRGKSREERLQLGRDSYLQYRTTRRRVELTGPEALRVAAQALAVANHGGAGRRQVEETVGLLDEVGNPFDPPRPWSMDPRMRKSLRLPDGRADEPGPQVLSHLPPTVRLAMEIAASEETERPLIHGELAHLEAAWKEAEEIAAIADSLVVPEEIVARLRDVRPDPPA